MHIAALLALVPLVAALPSAEQPGLSPGLASSDVHRRFPATRQEDVYDYIIVGAGVAGTTLANRLTANGLFPVLLLEAGQLDDQEDLITIPGNGANAANSKYNWNITSTPSPATGNRAIALPIGRGVGGSSLINQMVFVRGSSGDFDRWKEFGNSGWGWTEIFKNFKKNIVAAARELGIPILKDGYGGNNAGGFFTTHSVKPVENTRSSGRTAHYDVAAKRPNLKLIQYAHGSKIQVERGQAVGVEYIDTQTSTTKVVKAWREVIVSAGAVFSPQILQLSGIGDAKDLAAQGIKSVVDLPAVGRNLQDHPLVVAVNAITAPLSSANLSDTTFASEALALYKSNRTGPYANANAEFIMFLPISTFSSQPAALRQAAQSQTVGQFLPADYPDSVRQSFTKQHRLLTAGLSSDAQTPLEIFWNEGTVVSGVQHPYSRGSVKLVSNNPLTPPAVDPGYLTNPLDLAIMVDGFKLARRIANTTAIAPLAPFEVFPGPTVERGQAVGVEYIDTQTSTTKVAKAWREVIVSAGAVFSPQILQLSGIGDAKDLAAQGIKSVVDLPAVGRNLQDHPLVVAVHAITAPLSSANLSDTTFASEALALYKSNRTGPYANSNAEFIMFLPTSTFSSQPAALRQAAQSQTVGQFLPADYPASVRQSFAKQHRLLTAGLSSDAQTPLEIFWNEGTVVSGVQYPYSRGSVKLVSNNPLTPPAVDPGYLTNPLDLAIMVDGFKLARRIANTTAIAPLSPIEVFPGPTVATDADIEQYIRQNLASFAHYAGTCSVGPQNAGGVVDSNFRVYGVKNLRVVDASVIPLLPASHTSSTVYALAEKVGSRPLTKHMNNMLTVLFL
ncbi:Dehydrogenase xptC like protein [Verticillium longisporum]|nr:Dehydrogenase xptC like protein [Verticillium longisporum]